jgi:hypothetical protein
MPLLRPHFYAQERDSSCLAVMRLFELEIYRPGVVLLYTVLI